MELIEEDPGLLPTMIASPERDCIHVAHYNVYIE